MSGESNINTCIPVVTAAIPGCAHLVVRGFSGAPQWIARNTATESALLELE
jgi:hypothetical protein